jgi:hypothetical protein
MNSDPHDSVAWRSFGMLDAEEASLFEDAMIRDPGLRRSCLEMDRLAAAIAATTAEPVMPTPDQLEQLQRRLGLLRGLRKCPAWLAGSGWAATMLLAGVWAWTHFTAPAKTPSESPVTQAPVVPASDDSTMEIKRLDDEVEALRKNIEDFQERDRVMFQILPGRAMPLVMIMVPPGEKSVPLPQLTAVLGDALAAANSHPGVVEQTMDAQENTYIVEETDVAAAAPMAVPIYDAARDAGTLVVSNLPPAGDGNTYNLWVVMEMGGKPVCLGSLPENSALGADSFDFSLGSSMVLPAGFLLTLDLQGAPAGPTEENTVLQGPPRTH